MIVKKELTNVKGFTFVQNTTPVNFDVKDTWYNPDTNELKVRTAYGWVPYWEFNSDKAGYGLWSWGKNDYGQLSQNDVISRSSPTQVGSDINWSSIIIGQYHSLAIKHDGSLWAWGYNTSGQLGLNDRVNRSSPTQVGSDVNWSKIGIAYDCSFAIKTDNILWAWGYNGDGNLGLNDRVNRSSPTQVGSLTDWKDVISCCEEISLFLKDNNTIWTCGYNNFGQLGLNDRINRSSPTQVGSDTNWKCVSSGSTSSIAIKTDGTLWTWGRLNDGSGLNDTVSRSSPIQIGSDTNWSKVNCGYRNFSIIKTDGTLWMWGYNGKGELGLNDEVNRSSPVQVGNLTDWCLIAGGYKFTSAIKADGTLWAWGYNGHGQLGLNDEVNRSSPTQVGSDINWKECSFRKYSQLALKK